MRENFTLQCTECKMHNYRKGNNKKTNEKLNINKYCPKCQKHTAHKQISK